MDRIGSYFFQLGQYYLLDIPFLILFAVIAFRIAREKHRRLWFLFLPLTWIVILVLHWFFFGLGPRYAAVLFIQSILTDALAHGTPLLVLLASILIFKRKRRGAWITGAVTAAFTLLSFIAAQFLCVGFVLLFQWILTKAGG